MKRERNDNDKGKVSVFLSYKGWKVVLEVDWSKGFGGFFIGSVFRLV